MNVKTYQFGFNSLLLFLFISIQFQLYLLLLLLIKIEIVISYFVSSEIASLKTPSLLLDDNNF